MGIRKANKGNGGDGWLANCRTRMNQLRIIQMPSLQLTRAADYAVRVMVHLATLPAGARAKRESLAESAQVPGHFMGKVLQLLTRAQLIHSYRGARGGFELARPSSRINMLQVVEAIEGPVGLNVCLGRGDACVRRRCCGAHDVWRGAQASLLAVLCNAPLDRLAEESLRKQPPLKAPFAAHGA
jgi:Rrf2 family protein